MGQRTKYISILITLLFFLSGQYILAQHSDIEQLRIRRREIQALINLTNKQLKQTQNNERNSLKKLNTIQKNLSERKKLINSYNKEIKILQRKINVLAAEKRKLEERLEKLKSEYTELVQSTQIHKKSFSKLMFLLSAKNFNQTWRRFRYLQEFSDYRKQQLADIKVVKAKLEQKTAELNKHKQQQQELLQAKIVEHDRLKAVHKEEESFLTNIQDKEKKLSSNFYAQIRLRDRIDNKIEFIIKEEIKRQEEARKRKEKNNKKREQQESKQFTFSKVGKKTKKTSSKLYATSSESKLLTGGFAKNRGRLPWPVSRGFISRHFGKRTHSIFKHVTVNNKGTYFQAPVGTDARTIFEGIVTRRFSLPGSGNAVIIQHGNYRTVYGNLTSIFVNVGDRVKAKQSIGLIYSDEDTGTTELLFQVWQNMTLQNPENWITK